MELSTSTAAAKAHASRTRITASAFVPHEADSVTFVEDCYGVRYRRTCEAGCIRYERMPPEHGRFGCDGSYRIDVEAASPADRAARKSGKVTLTLNVQAYGAGALLEYVAEAFERSGRSLERICQSDFPGIAADIAAKSVQPTPEPVLSIGGEQVTESEITRALALLRGQNAPAVKETPRGLLCVREGFDHRLGAWNEA